MRGEPDRSYRQERAQNSLHYPQSWLNLQTVYDLRVAEITNAKKIRSEITPMASEVDGFFQSDRGGMDLETHTLGSGHGSA
jgi:hypothetical protein